MVRKCPKAALLPKGHRGGKAPSENAFEREAGVADSVGKFPCCCHSREGQRS